jgi:hypothetical protein
MILQLQHENFNSDMFRPYSGHLQGVRINYIYIKHSLIVSKSIDLLHAGG